MLDVVDAWHDWYRADFGLQHLLGPMQEELQPSQESTDGAGRRPVGGGGSF